MSIMTEERMSTSSKEQMSAMTAESAAVEGTTPRTNGAISPRARRWNRLLGPYAALAGNHNLAWLFGGQVVSSLGDWLYVTALIVLVYNLSHSATLAALLTAVRLLPYVVGLPIGGVLADRYDRRTLMIVSDAGRAICMLGLLAVGSRQTTVWLAFPLVFLTTALGSLFRPALGATVPTVAGGPEELSRANALMGQIDGLSLVLGPALGGMLVLLGAPRLAFALNAASYAASALTLTRLRLPSPRQAAPHAARGHAGETNEDGMAASEAGRRETTGWLAETMAGFRVLFGQNGGALGAVTLATAGLCACNGASWTLLVVLAERIWHLGGQGAGFLLAGYGLGGLAGGFAVGALTRRVRPIRGFTASLITASASLILLGLSPAGLLPFALIAAFGLADMVNQVVGNTLIQTATPPALLGRVFGAFEATVVGAVVLGALAAGPLIGLLGPRLAMVALALPSLALVLGAWSRLAALDRDRPEREPATTESGPEPAADVA